MTNETTYKTTEGITDTEINPTTEPMDTQDTAITTTTESITDTDTNPTEPMEPTGIQDTAITTTTTVNNILDYFDNVNCYLGISGYMYMLADDVARKLGFVIKDDRLPDTKDVLDDETDIPWSRINKYLEEEGYESVGNGKFMREDAVLALAMRADSEKAKEFRRTAIEFIIPNFKSRVSSEKSEQRLNSLKQRLENRAETDYYDDVAMHDSFIYDTGIIAKDYGWSAKQLITELEKLNIIYLAHVYYHKEWALHSYYDNKGYAVTKIEEVVGYSGEISSTPIITMWTQEGKEFIYQTLKEEGILPIKEAKSSPETETDPDNLKQESLPENEIKYPPETETDPDCLKQGVHQKALLSNYVFVPVTTPFGMGFRQVYLPF